MFPFLVYFQQYSHQKKNQIQILQTMSYPCSNLKDLLQLQQLFMQEQHYHNLNQLQVYGQQQGWQQQQFNPNCVPNQISSANQQHLQDLTPQLPFYGQGYPVLGQQFYQVGSKIQSSIKCNQQHLNLGHGSSQYQPSYLQSPIDQYVTSRQNNSQNTQPLTFSHGIFEKVDRTFLENKHLESEQKFLNQPVKIENIQGSDPTFNSLTKIQTSDQNEDKEQDQEQKISPEQSDSSYNVSLTPENQANSEVQINEKRNKQRVKPRKQIQKMSKNIPKNIFKGIIKYILGKKDDIRTYFHNDQEKVSGFIKYIKHCKNTVLSMQQMKNFLHTIKNEEYTKLSRILSYQFVDKHFIAYIYNSKIKCRREHLANKGKFIKIICNQPAYLQKTTGDKI